MKQLPGRNKGWLLSIVCYNRPGKTTLTFEKITPMCVYSNVGLILNFNQTCHYIKTNDLIIIPQLNRM